MIKPEDREKIEACLHPEQGSALEIGLFRVAEAVKDVREHEHYRDDIYCLNLTSWMGDAMPVVLKRLLDEAAEVDALLAEVRELRKRDALLSAMEAAGVDNWGGMEFVDWPEDEEDEE